MTLVASGKLKKVMVAGALASALVLCLLMIPAIAQEGKKITQVVVTGNQNINKETIENVIKLVPGSEYSKDAVENDRVAIDALGYFSAVSTRNEETPEGLRVIYDVTENPVVKSISIAGSDPVSTETILGLMRTKPNQVLNYDALDKDVTAIQDYYRQQGYVAYVTEDLGIDRVTGELVIPILVSTVENVRISGNRKTKTYVFLREMKTKPGMVFNMKTLQDDLARIYNLDLLETYQSPRIEPGSTIGELDVVIPVVEKKTGNVGVGIGYSAGSKLVGRAELTETNFRGRGEGVTLLWETGTSEGLDGSSSYELGFYKPWIDEKHTSLSFNVYNKLLYRFSSAIFGSSQDINGQTYNERHKGGTLGLSRPLTEKTRAYITLRGESVETANLESTVLNRFVASDGNVRSGTLRLTNNTRDFDRDPADGWYRSISAELGSSDVIQHFSSNEEDDQPLKGPYQKLQIDLRHYRSAEGRKITPTDKRTTIAFRLECGIGNGDLPFFEQFFVGGAESLRGYREDRFWGDKMLLASVEYRRPVSQGLTGVLFADYGDAWGAPSIYDISDELTQHNNFSPRLGVGLGLRVNTPIGNLRLDYGVGSEGARTHFSIGQAF